MKALLQEANMVADELAKIQPNTIVESVIRRLVTELIIQRQHYDNAIGLGKGTAEGGAGGTDDRAANAQPGASPLGEADGQSQNRAGDGQ